MSDDAGDGELGILGPDSSITGNATVQRYTSYNRSYRMMSSPVTTTTTIHANWQEGALSNMDNPSPGFGTHITGSTVDQQNGFDGTGTGNPSIFTADLATQAFVPVDNTNVNTLTVGNPYLLFVRGDRTIDLSDNQAAGETVLRATGSLYNGTKTMSYPTAIGGNIVMFGNPYQSTVDIKSVFTNSTNIIPTFYYVYDPTLADQGGYVTVNLESGDGTNTAGSTANKYLQPGQGAQMMAMSSGPVLVFNESDKAPGNFTTTNRNAMSESNMLTAQLYTTDNFNNGGSVHDSFGILFAEGNDNALTARDAVKPMNFYENLGIDRDGTYLSIERREMPEGGENFPIYTNGYQHSEYVLKMDLNGLDGMTIYLDDNFKGTSTILEQGSINYSFTIDATNPESKATDRFAIRVGERLNVGDNELLSEITLYPNPMGNQLNLSNPKNVQLDTASIYDLTGRLIQKVDLKGATSEMILDVSALSRATYLVVINGENGQISKLMVKQ